MAANLILSLRGDVGGTHRWWLQVNRNCSSKSQIFRCKRFFFPFQSFVFRVLTVAWTVLLVLLLIDCWNHLNDSLRLQRWERQRVGSKIGRFTSYDVLLFFPPSFCLNPKPIAVWCLVEAFHNLRYDWHDIQNWFNTHPAWDPSSSVGRIWCRGTNPTPILLLELLRFLLV